MTTIYHAYTEHHGECEAMFREDGTMLGMWACNDASWRNEYFSPFMAELGIEVRDAPDEMIEALKAKAKELWGDDEEEEEEEE